MDISADAMRLVTYLSANNICLDSQQSVALGRFLDSQYIPLHLATLKKTTHQLRNLLKDMGHPVKQSLAFEVVARYLGYQNWNCARSAASRSDFWGPLVVAHAGMLCFEIFEKEAGVEALLKGLNQLPAVLPMPFRLRLVSLPEKDASLLSDWRDGSVTGLPLFQWLADSRRNWLSAAMRQNQPLFGLAKGTCLVRHFLALELPHAALVNTGLLTTVRDTLAVKLGCRLTNVDSRAILPFFDFGQLPDGFMWTASVTDLNHRVEPPAIVFNFDCDAGILNCTGYAAGVKHRHRSSQGPDQGRIRTANLPRNLSDSDLRAALMSSWLNDGMLLNGPYGVPLASSSGNLNLLNIWAPRRDQRTSSLFLLSAISGSGKSFLADELIIDSLSRKKNVRVVDFGGSYKRLVKLFGGKEVRFELDSPVSLNLFTGVARDTALSRLLPLWTSLLQELFGFPDARATDLHALLERTWKLHREKLDVPTLVDAFLASSVIELVRLGAALQSFYFRNRPWMEGPSVALDSANPLLVFELECVKSDVALTKSLQQLLLANLAQESILSSTQTLYLVDEGWCNLTGLSRKFSRQILQTLTRGNHSFGTLLMSLQDANSVPMAQELLEQADSLLLLRQKSHSLETFAAGSSPFARVIQNRADAEGENDFPDGTAATHRLKELCAIHSGNGFSQFAVLTREKYLGVYNFAPDLATYYAYTTNPRDLRDFNALTEEGHTAETALKLQVKREAARRRGVSLSNITPSIASASQQRPAQEA